MISIDQLLFLLRISQSILVSEREIWFSSFVTQELKTEINQALKKHRAGVRSLLADGAIDTCCNPTLHRQFWYHSGLQVYRCALCEKKPNPVC